MTRLHADLIVQQPVHPSVPKPVVQQDVRHSVLAVVLVVGAVADVAIRVCLMDVLEDVVVKRGLEDHVPAVLEVA